MQKGSTMSKTNSRTRAFETVNNKGFKSNRSRQKLVVAIFVVIILILLAFATLIIGQIVNKVGPRPTLPGPSGSNTIPKDAGDVKIGSLLFIGEKYQYNFPTDVSNIVNLYQYQNNSENSGKTHINGYCTYSLTMDRITLDKTTLEAFNQMILDYCGTLDLSGASKNAASNLNVAWGNYDDVDEYLSDIASEAYGAEYYDHALGTTLTLRRNSDSAPITEQILKDEYTWIYENAHKYGFIIRFPDECKDHTGFDSSKRVHLRYVGIEHATYIHQNEICFEEYLELVRNYGVDNPLTFTADNGNTYEVYYVTYSGNPTSVPVPKDNPYTISGDNMNGFIVTVENTIE